MKVKFVRERVLQGAGPNGPLTRVFAVGEVVDLPEAHSIMFIASGDAVDAAKAPQKAPVAAAEAPVEPTAKAATPKAKKAR